MRVGRELVGAVRSFAVVGMNTGNLPILAVDSDGCALDAMSLKHRLCFTPAIIEVWALESVRELVVEESLRINLYSPLRGVNRFEALAELFRCLREKLPAADADCLPASEALEAWVASAPVLSETALREAIEQATGVDRHALARVLQWTTEVNRRVALLASPPAFPGVEATLRRAEEAGIPVFVVSSATKAAISGEWKAAGLDRYVQEIFGQEDGTKSTVLKRIATNAESPALLLMVGDAPGDRTAARAVGAHFWPIVPDLEEESWTRLREEILPVFRDGAVPQARLSAWEDCFARALVT